MIERININNLKQILSAGENACIEFHAKVPTPDVFAREIVAFANADGGHLLFGVYFDGSIIGAIETEIETALHECQSIIRPTVQTDVYSIKSDGKAVVAVRVFPSALRPVFANGLAVIRTGAQVVALSPEQILNLIPGREKLENSVNQALENFARSISEQTITIDALRLKLIEGQKWQSKLKEWILAGIVGATIGAILTGLTGLF
ncbi:MAG TPA: hypothetical protein DCR95_07695 [Desulfobacter sp.]|nr:hypothetical protein [Desulfobacter sp.]